MEEQLGVPIVVQNVEGAGGVIGATQLARADADGYQLGLMPFGPVTTQPHLRQTDYDSESWTTICRVVSNPMAVLVAPDSGMVTFEDLIERASGEEAVLTAGPAPGSLPHVAQAALGQAYDLNFRYVPHEGAAAVATSLLGGQVDVFIDIASNAERLGLTPLALLAEERHPSFPDLPTVAELGGPPLDYAVWYGVFAPAGLDEAVANRLSEACGTAVDDPEFQERMTAQGHTIAYLGATDFSAFFASQYQTAGELLSIISSN